MNELAGTPGYDVYTKLMALNTSIYILDKNCNDLEAFVHELTTSPKWRYLFMVENREALHNVSQDVVRRLHNFVSAAASLRDHTRAFYNKHYKDGDLMPEYHEKKRVVFGEDPLAQFTLSLRKYCQHYRSPHMNYRTAWDPGGAPSSTTAIILKEDLLLFDGWNKQARSYLDQIEGGVDVLSIAKVYRTKVLSFYEWFQTEQERIHRDELEDFKAKEAELLRLQLEDKLDRCLSTGDSLDCSEQSLFLHMFLKRDYEQLSELQPRSRDRAELAISLVRERFDINDQLAAKLRNAYGQPGFAFYGEVARRQSISQKLSDTIRSLINRVLALLRSHNGSA
jgi:hypothetical protein